MSAHRLAAPLLIVIALALSGCDDSERLIAENKQLKAELHARQSELAELEVRLQTDIETRRIDAAVAAGCDFLVPMCPSGITAAGRNALAQGYSPGSKGLFWIIAFVKTLLVGCAIGAALGTFRCTLHRNRLKVIHAEAERLRSEITAAKMRIKDAAKPLTDINSAVIEAEARLSRYEELQFQALADLKDLCEEIEQAQTELSQVLAEIERIKAVKAALGAF
ncbi:hypothetical protein [Burkholderia vietnamiensis]|uniref:hypothetical protein n=1 Tax=Burkholderia vietnamiensis TaxID=60552 RepID=UPI0008422E2A|nr:hypothetical protein [Burkholderia vietnamiensis]AOK41837.1 hypothetical protein WL96_12695 [Burkholderia vietnamiensis]